MAEQRIPRDSNHLAESVDNAIEKVSGADYPARQQEGKALTSGTSTPQSSSSGQKRSREASPLVEEDRHDDDKTSMSVNVDAPTWKGWAELENDPMIFTTILQSWGVQDVRVNEVIPLDSVLEKNPSTVLGLIFLSRWAPSEDNTGTSDCPKDLWFANQISTFSCATLALMNIINNQKELSLGPELQAFRTQTLAMGPKARGIQLDNFQFVKDIHNSFSRELDRMQVDLRVKEEAAAAARKSRRPKKSKKNFTKHTKKRRVLDDDEEMGFHFVAYVPAQDHVWRLDGTEAHPQDMGPVEEGDSWLMKIIADLQIILEASETDGTEFSLLSLDHESRDGWASEATTQVARMREDWSPFIAHMLRLHAEKGDLGELVG